MKKDKIDLKEDERTELPNRVCPICGNSLNGKHKNRKFCSNSCYEKSRYLKYGQRSTKDQRIEWYKKRLSTPGYKEKLRDQGIKRYYKIQEFIRAYKINKGCTDCGYNAHHAALEFDHINNDKELNVCMSKSISQAKLEIQKCEVVCSNCHKIRTYNRLQQKNGKDDVKKECNYPIDENIDNLHTMEDGLLLKPKYDLLDSVIFDNDLNGNENCQGLILSMGIPINMVPTYVIEYYEGVDLKRKSGTFIEGLIKCLDENN